MFSRGLTAEGQGLRKMTTLMKRTLITLTTSAAVLLSVSAYAADAPKAPTFTKDIAPIFQDKCEACHRPDSMAPMSLVTYADVRPWLRSIKTRVADRQMPPWQIDRNVGVQKFKNDRS